jgi:hypothetical protein
MFMTFRSMRSALCALAAVALSSAAIAEPSPVVFRFSTVGDSRADAKDKLLDAQDRRWLQNTKVLSRILDEISAHHAQALMFNGDMVMGYTRDPALLDREYAYWRGMVAGLMERGTYVLPVPGNHELQMPTPQPDGKPVKLAQPELADAWRANMGDLIVDEARWKRTTGLPLSGWSVDNSPAPGRDGITTSQHQLSYSLDAGPVHIAIINTDPVGHDSSAPVAWLRQDFEAAKARGAKRFFVFGHKMAFAYDFNPRAADKESGLEVRPAERDAFWDLIEAFGATYFSGHEHIYNAAQPRLSQGGKAWQVIVGSGGSPFAASPAEASRPSDRMYAWAEVAVRADGRAEIVVRGFDEHLGPTQVIEQWQLGQGSQ